jgi:hypothetical protein
MALRTFSPTLSVSTSWKLELVVDAEKLKVTSVIANTERTTGTKILDALDDGT